jgi:hypothetical protein
MARIATLESRLGTLRTADAGSGFDAALAAQLETAPGDGTATGDLDPGTGPATGSATGFATGFGSGSPAGATDPTTMASYLSVLSGQATTGSTAGTTAGASLADWSGASSIGGATATGGTAPWPVGTGLTPAVPREPGEYATLQPPAELAGYGNGTIPAEALAPLGIGSHRLYAPAAASFQVMAADAADAGVSIGVTDSYRSYESQVDLAARKGLYRHGGLAAVPGTSNHGWGLALDLDLDADGQAWMDQNAWRYGFVESVPREPWHWEYRPAGAGS